MGSYTMLLKNYYCLIIFAGVLFLTSCTHQQVKLNYDFDAELVVLKKDVTIVFVPANNHMPPHLEITKTERYRFTKDRAPMAFKKDITIGPLMHDVKLNAQVQKNGKLARTIQSQKVSQTIMSQNQRTWSPARTKLALTIPYVKSDEEIVVTTSYSWMDIRWHEPILLEEDVPTLASEVIVDVPYGVSSQFQSTKNGETFSLAPQPMDHAKTLWGQKDNQAGLGTRFIFTYDFGKDAAVRDPALRLQLFFSFESPVQSLRTPPFDNWERVSSYLYDRIDRYDYPSNAVRDFSRKETDPLPDNFAKLGRILSFLSNEVEARPVFGSYLEQDVQPAPKTFSRRFGSPFDKAILGKAMLMAIGIDAEIMASTDAKQNPVLLNLYSPALFHRIILAITLEGRTYFWDPSVPFVELEAMPIELYSARLLAIRKNKGQLFSMPARLPDLVTLEPEKEIEVLIPMGEPKDDAAHASPVGEENGFVVEPTAAPAADNKVPKEIAKSDETSPIIEEHRPKVEDFKPATPLPKEEKEPSAEEPKPNIEEPKGPPKPIIEEPAPLSPPSSPTNSSETIPKPSENTLETDSLFEDRASILEEMPAEILNAPEKSTTPPKP